MTLSFRVLIVVFAVALAACGGAVPTPITPSRGADSASLGTLPLSAVTFANPILRTIRAAETPVRSASGHSADDLYVSQFYGKGVYEYILPDAKNRGPSCDIYGSLYVNGLSVDSSGVLWVPLGNDSRVRSYAAGCGKPGLVLHDRKGQAADVAFNNKLGTIYVDNAQSVGGNSAFIGVYHKGKTSPSETLTNASAYRSFGIAVDENGNVFQSFTSSASAVGILEYPRGKGNGVLLSLNGLVQPGGLTFDKNDDLLVADQGSLSVLVFAPPYSGSPKASISMRGTPVYAKLNGSDSRVYVTNYDAGSVDVYAYPAGTYLYSISKYLYQPNYVEGVALRPALE